MRIHDYAGALLFFLTVCLPELTSLSAQSLRLDAGAIRQPVTLTGDRHTTYAVCDLVPGQAYVAVLSGLPNGIAPKWLLEGNYPEQAAKRADGAFCFRAVSPCMDLSFELPSKTSTRGYLTVAPEIPPVSGQEHSGSAGLEVTQNSNIIDLVKNILFGNACGDVSNITYTGHPGALGAFSNGQTNLGLSDGIVLSTGQAYIWQGANSQSNATGGFGNAYVNDPDLGAISGGQQFDLAALEFDLVPSGNNLFFQFVFGSEEYCEYVGTNFSDAFGVFISGPGINGVKNIALVPATAVPVSVNNVNHVVNPNYFINNNVFDPPCQNLPPYAPDECELDGWTKVMLANLPVMPCATYHVKIAIADIADGAWDSAVFLRAGTGVNTISVVAAANYPNTQTAAYEDCQSGYIRIERVGSSTALPVPVSFTVAGTAIPGIDYEPLISPVVIPPGASEILLPVTVYADAHAEGAETIQLNVNNACACGQTLSFIIEDLAPLSVHNPDVVECGVALLSPTVSGGLPPYSYVWNTGSTQDQVLALGPGTKTYTVTVTDLCGKAQSATAAVTLNPPAPASMQVQFCAGDSVQVFGQWFSETNAFTYTAAGQNGQCDTSMTVSVQKVQKITRQMTVPLCPGQAFVSGGNTYFAPSTFALQQPGVNGACDTMTTYKLELAAAVIRNDTVHFCTGSSVTIGGTVYSSAGTVQIAIPGAAGACDTLINYTLSVLPYTAISNTLGLCPGETYTQGGQSYTAPGSVSYTMPGQNGQCDTVYTTILKLATPAASSVSLKCPAAQTVSVEAGDPPVAVNFDSPVASTDCPCPGITVQQTGGLPSGSNFPLGTTNNCFTAEDICGNTTACCVAITIKEKPVCDAKTSGCIKWEFISAKQDAELRTTFRLRITNNCANQLVSADFQLPKGLVADMPADNSTYTAPSGRTYSVTNPNFSPFYSIRFAPEQAGISGGASDIFEYTLQPQAQMNYILALVRLSPSIYYAAHLTSFNCVGTQLVQSQDRSSVEDAGIQLFPNPTDDLLFIEAPAVTRGERLPLRIFDAKGAMVVNTTLEGVNGPQPVELPAGLTDGVYTLEVLLPNGKAEMLRFVVHKK